MARIHLFLDFKHQSGGKGGTLPDEGADDRVRLLPGMPLVESQAVPCKVAIEFVQALRPLH